eukprot:TRINITY_DN11916_c0_g2_i3.p2 TRINITY_DN11916_c0_g2~~TRINITY_DN11916_c0_g2_i3.p2  ORF type:complete len:134 (+),score=27.62 TRINITY_DN11916_c0_g2_i3:1296-1697(+)
MLLPIFSWSNLEMFWVDACNLSASPGFFQKAAKAWPKLRTLDLYDNPIGLPAEGLAAFAGHEQLHQVLVQKCELHGVLPGKLFLRSTSLVLLQANQNKHLRVQVPPSCPDESGLLLDSWQVLLDTQDMKESEL